MATDLSQGFDYRKATQGKSVCKFCDMSGEMANEAMDIVASTIEKYTKAEKLELENATRFIKEQMDKLYGPSWHVIVGEGFSFDVNSQRENLLYMFYSGTMGVLLWKC